MFHSFLLRHWFEDMLHLTKIFDALENMLQLETKRRFLNQK